MNRHLGTIGWNRPIRMRALLGEITVQSAESKESFCLTSEFELAGMTSSATFLDCHDVEVLRTSRNHFLDDTGIKKCYVQTRRYYVMISDLP